MGVEALAFNGGHHVHDLLLVPQHNGDDGDEGDDDWDIEADVVLAQTAGW